QLARPVFALRNCFQSVDDQIQNHLLQLNSISTHVRKILLELLLQENTISACFVLCECKHLDNHFVEIDQIASRWRLFHEGANSRDDCARTVTVFNDAFDGLPCFSEVGSCAAKPTQSRISIRDDRGEWLVYFMCDRRR